MQEGAGININALKIIKLFANIVSKSQKIVKMGILIYD